MTMLMRDTLTWLHISDIHFRPKNDWKDSIVRDALLQNLKNHFRNDESLVPDLIFCTGDIAYGELTAGELNIQYSNAKIFFEKLLSICKKNSAQLPKERLFIVPGNHDINRLNIDSDEQKEIHNMANEPVKYVHYLNQIFNEVDPKIKRIISRQKEYSDFVKEFLPHQFDPTGRNFYTRSITVNNINVSICGFNTSWSSSGKEDEGKLWMAAQWQFNNALKSRQSSQVHIGLAHHPEDWLTSSDRSIYKRRTQSDFHFWLHGHSHDLWVNDGQRQITIAAGAINATIREEFGFNIVRLDFSKLSGRIFLYEHRPGDSNWTCINENINTDNIITTFALPISIRKRVQPNIWADSQGIGDEEYLDQDIYEARYTEEQFNDLLESYSDSLQDDYRREIINEILGYIWEFIVFSPKYASKLIQSIADSQSKISHIIKILCKISLGDIISEDELISFFTTLKKESSGQYNNIYLLFILRVSRHVLYHYIDLANSDIFKETITDLFEVKSEFIDKFFTDLYFRHLSHYISIPPHLVKTVNTACDRYLKRDTNSALSQIYHYVYAPTETLEHFGAITSINKIYDIAPRCNDTIDSKWCVIALLKILPLVEKQDEEISSTEELRILIDKIPYQYTQHSSFIISLYLKSLLRSFIRSKNIDYLKDYEKYFYTNYRKLCPPQVINLQIEYASTIYTLCDSCDDETLFSLKITYFFKMAKPPVDDPLFHNALIENFLSQKYIIKIDRLYRKNLFKWLSGYILILLRSFAKPSIEENHLRAFQYAIAFTIYQYRSIFGNSVLKSLELTHKNLSTHTPSFCASSCASFSFINISQHTDIVFDLISKALEADKYSILRSSTQIAKAFYCWHHYQSSYDANKISELEANFESITEIGKTDAKLFWIYYATSKIKELPNEQLYISELNNIFSKLNRKIYQLALRKNEEVNLVFPDDIISCSKHYFTKSIIAQAMTNELTNAEAWNILGTTIFNICDKNNILHLDQAANFYIAARCFSRSKSKHDQKYCYNYIRCKSMRMLLKYSDKNALFFFIRDTSFYITRFEASQFYHREQCLVPFYQLVNKTWALISNEIKKIVLETINNTYWIKESQLLTEHICQLRNY